ncbi:MAG TPA: MaoC/PaaZ C-terminal domain-containing protein [Actinomycetota bacterium]
MAEPRVRFEDLAVGQEIPSLARVVSREDVKAYADASGDQNPLHQNDDFARAVGFPGIIAHGMFSMGHLATCLTGWLGEPGPLRRLRAQFRSPVFMGDTIVAGGRIRSLDPEARSAILEVWVSVERDGRTEFPIRKSEAEVRFTTGA